MVAIPNTNLQKSNLNPSIKLPKYDNSVKMYGLAIQETSKGEKDLRFMPKSDLKVWHIGLIAVGLIAGALFLNKEIKKNFESDEK